MTDSIETPTGTLSIQRTAEGGRTFVMIRKGGDGRGLRVPTFELLAAIDAAEPDAMRAYLRETAPEVIADVYRPAPAAADHFDYLDPEIPEADSPEDVDEQPEPVITVTPEALAAAEQLGRYVAAIGEAYRRGLTR